MVKPDKCDHLHLSLYNPFKDQAFNPGKQQIKTSYNMKWSPNINYHTIKTYKCFKIISIWKNKNKGKHQEIMYQQMKRKH